MSIARHKCSEFLRDFQELCIRDAIAFTCGSEEIKVRGEVGDEMSNRPVEKRCINDKRGVPRNGRGGKLMKPAHVYIQ